MTGRDRIVLIGVIVVVILAGGWIKLVSPERQKASKLSAQVATAKSQLESAESKLASARAAQSQYNSAYAAMVNLGKAVPPSQEVPSLIYQLVRASNEKSVDFTSIGPGSGGSGSGASTTVTAPAASGTTAPASGTTAPASGSTAPASGSASSASTTALNQLPFTFVFEGSYFDLERLLSELTGFTTRTSAGTLQVSGRLLTVQSLKLSPANSSSSEKGAGGWLTGTITATAYTAPAPSASLLGVAPAATTGSATSAASTSGASSSPTAPAIVRVNP
jgi:hypothetical protein